MLAPRRAFDAIVFIMSLAPPEPDRYATVHSRDPRPAPCERFVEQRSLRDRLNQATGAAFGNSVEGSDGRLIRKDYALLFA